MYRDPTEMRRRYKAKVEGEERYWALFDKAIAGDQLAQKGMMKAAAEITRLHQEWMEEAQHFVFWKKP